MAFQSVLINQALKPYFYSKTFAQYNICLCVSVRLAN